MSSLTRFHEQERQDWETNCDAPPCPSPPTSPKEMADPTGVTTFGISGSLAVR